MRVAGDGSVDQSRQCLDDARMRLNRFTVRFTPDDYAILARLRELTGGSTASVLRTAIREMLAEREARQAPLARTGT